MRRSWRDKARARILQVLRECEGLSDAEIKKKIRAAYPFGERKYYPYKIWLEEVNAIVYKKKKIKNVEKKVEVDGQLLLFFEQENGS